MLKEGLDELRETNKSLSQQLGKAKIKARRLEKEVEMLKKALSEKTVALDRAERKLRQGQRQASKCHTLLLQKDQERADAIKDAEKLQEQLARMQSENLSLRQQLADVQNEATQAQLVSDAFTHEANTVEKEAR